MKKLGIENILLICGAFLFFAILAITLIITSPKGADDGDDDTGYAAYVELGEYKDLPLDIAPMDVADSDVDAVFQELIDSRGDGFTDDANGVADAGDIVYLYYEIDGTGETSFAEGILGENALPEGFDAAVTGLKPGESVVVPAPDGSGADCTITINNIRMPAEINDEYVASLGIGDITTVDGLKQNIRTYLEEEQAASLETQKKDRLLEMCYEGCTFKDIPDELVEPFREVLRGYLDRLVASYSESSDAPVTADDILKETYEHDGISSVDEYLEMYGLHSARVYAMCEKIARNEGIKVEDIDVYSYAAQDWHDETGGDIPFSEYMADKDLAVYVRSALLDAVTDYLYESSDGKAAG